MKTFVHTNTYSHIPIVVVFVTFKSRRYPKYLSVGEWTRELRCIHDIEHYSTIKRKAC